MLSLQRKQAQQELDEVLKEFFIAEKVSNSDVKLTKGIL